MRCACMQIKQALGAWHARRRQGEGDMRVRRSVGAREANFGLRLSYVSFIGKKKRNCMCAGLADDDDDDVREGTPRAACEPCAAATTGRTS